MTMLEIRNLSAYYGNICALRGISFQVNAGETVALIGNNGAGKTTTVRTISGLMKPREGEIRFMGERIDHLRPDQIVRLGISHSPEGRKVFPAMTVRENLVMGAYIRKDAKEVKRTLDYVLHLFPRLEERFSQSAETLSGGEQQMLAIGRALMSEPKLLILDEPSLGLAPLIIKQIFELIRVIQQQGITILIIEQNARQALKVAHRGIVLETGRIAFEENAKEMLHNDRVRQAYLGEK
ncbi:amino acid ABC transporter ATPase [Paenibacillus beijingensis]|uniref:Amino acid ABC transporter ATPase n=2 Tax=Paenibacillus beijingensis TaxID=1126833 RepID=A0A0D5NFX8_9BACL|nr:amino acid ABC transporter ATPase [Paenibacillus beijingensis]